MLLEVSAPHTVHLAVLFSLSVAKDRLACSRISAAITGSCLGCGLRLIASAVLSE